jgi:hypothetical protein
MSWILTKRMHHAKLERISSLENSCKSSYNKFYLNACPLDARIDSARVGQITADAVATPAGACKAESY